jgi:hypothetical protein
VGFLSVTFFFNCEVVRDLWSSLCNLFGVDWVMPKRVRELLMSWGCQMGSHDILKVWRLAPLCVMWCIWREHNVQSFEDRET